MRAAKVQASLRIFAVSPEPPLLANTGSESRGTFRQKTRSLALLNGWACAVKICHDGMLEDTNSLDEAQFVFNDFQLPFRRDYVADSHDGILVYVKAGIPCKRRVDLELMNTECLWVEINIRNKKILVGIFYRPPNSHPPVWSDIENSMGMATDTGITAVISI